ncbi:hypothetical protein [Conexibacter sp. DBS9H8]|uniref:hypothetical protein n=1 Tax=Conexibacter sp. DBS9H8 TaxID=2937801 RepID=UPI00200BF086|nr:hypothetical protein [Conexibacter sp. DBS9H8]
MSHSRLSAGAAALVAAGAIGAATAAPAIAHTPVRTHTLTLTGTVASTDPATHDFVLDATGGTMYTIHIGRLPVVGETITVTVHKAHKGLYETNSFKVDKKAGKHLGKGHAKPKHGKAKGHGKAKRHGKSA